MEIIFLDQVSSTQTYLKEYIQKNGYTTALAIVTQNQTNGIGSRENSWDGEEGNLFFSFVFEKSLFPSDLPMQSISIYVSYFLQETLSMMGSAVWLKWPNDFYIDTYKVGGTLTNISQSYCYCGIGLNLHNKHSSYGCLDIDFDIKVLLENYFRALKQKTQWKKIFSKYKLQFENSKNYTTTLHHKKVSMKDAFLNNDGSITIENEKVFSLR